LKASEKISTFYLPPASSCLVCLDKLLDRAFIGLFNIVGEKAGWQLTYFPVIRYTLTTNAFSAARFIAAVASRLVSLSITFLCHHIPLFIFKIDEIPSGEYNFPP
jgi:hypothetical protein